MSYKENLQRATTPAELHEVMHDIWAWGSPNWTYDAAAWYVSPHLHDALRRYFAASGVLATHLPETPAPEEQAGAPPQPEDTRRYASLSELIATFHHQLAEVRSAQDEPLFSTGVAAGEVVCIAPDETSPPPPKASARADSTHVRFQPGFDCLICDTWIHGAGVFYRGTEMCASCAAKLHP